MKTKFNIIDAIIIVVILAVVIAGVFIFLNLKNNDNNASVPSNSAEIKFVIEVNNLSETAANSFKDAVGKDVSFGETASGSGIITNVEIVPYKKWIKNTDEGTFFVSEIPNKYTANVTIKTNVEKTDASFTSGSEVISVGKKMPFNSFGIAAEECFIIDLFEVE